MKNSFATGNQIYLRPASLSDAKGNWYKWLNDRETTKYLVDRFWPNTKELQIQFIKNSIENKSRLIFCVCLKRNDKQIGQCALSYINWVHRFADISIIIGEKKYKKGTLALETYNLLLQIAFERLNLLNVKSATCNPMAEKFHKFLGFKKVGSFKKIFFIDNKYLDLHYYCMRRKDWLQKDKK